MSYLFPSSFIFITALDVDYQKVFSLHIPPRQDQFYVFSGNGLRAITFKQKKQTKKNQTKNKKKTPTNPPPKKKRKKKNQPTNQTNENRKNKKFSTAEVPPLTQTM